LDEDIVWQLSKDNWLTASKSTTSGSITVAPVI